jgi:hypothetical protein
MHGRVDDYHVGTREIFFAVATDADVGQGNAREGLERFAKRVCVGLIGHGDALAANVHVLCLSRAPIETSTDKDGILCGQVGRRTGQIRCS